MSSLLRSPAIRRALSAASSGRPQGVSFLRAASEAAPAFGGEGGATVRRRLGLLTVPRRYLSGELQNSQPTAPPPDQVDQLRQYMKQLKDTVERGYVITGCIKLVVEDCKPGSAFRQWSRFYGAVILLLILKQRMTSVKQG